ncbi:MAG: DNA-processing protein DprA [Jatrophihabitans sp.]|uniref:DNA-processing protein DprA n=1 Tax=Jatrophihabitans sp. TaxID=1932789 RepID=UPI003F7E0B33
MGGVNGVDPEVLLARAYLNRVAEPDCVPLWGFVEEVGPVQAARDIRAGVMPDEVRGPTDARRSTVDPEADLLAAERHGIRLVVPESPDWPAFAMQALQRVGHERLVEWRERRRSSDESGEPIPPLALWVQGPAFGPDLGVRAVGVVGARASTAYGNRVAGDLAFGLAHARVAVVSGGAFGIDAAAHRGALGAGGVTVLVSAGGLDRPYPPGNEQLFRLARETGAVVSESPPGSAPQRRRFLTRNRLIASLTAGTVVVEAALRSGAINTATHCRRLGRPVMAVPGPVGSAASAGCHALLRRPDDPAVLVTSVEQVLELVGSMGEGGDPAGEKRTSVLDGLDLVDQRVFDAVPAHRAATIDELVVVSGLGLGDVLGALPSLQRLGIVVAEPDGYRARPVRAVLR